MADDDGRFQLNVRVAQSVADWVEATASERGVSQAWLVERLLTECMDRMIPVSEWRLTTPAEVSLHRAEFEANWPQPERCPANDLGGSMGCVLPASHMEGPRATSHRFEYPAPAGGYVDVHEGGTR